MCFWVCMCESREQRAENGEENNLEGKRDSSGESGVDRGEEREGGEQGSLSLVCYPEEIGTYLWGTGNCGRQGIVGTGNCGDRELWGQGSGLAAAL